MSSPVMVDTSAWTHALRRHGDTALRARIEKLLSDRLAAWCEIIRLELWTGVRNDAERHVLQRLDQTLPRLPISDAVWNTAAISASKIRAAGITVPANDLLIYTCAKAFGSEIEHADRHYDLLKNFGL